MFDKDKNMRIMVAFSRKNKIIYLSNALSNPGAMMIKALHAIVAYWTVWTPRGPVNHAGIAILHFHKHPINHYFLYTGELQPPRRAPRQCIPIRELFLRWVCCARHNPRILGWSNQEQHKHLQTYTEENQCSVLSWVHTPRCSLISTSRNQHTELT